MGKQISEEWKEIGPDELEKLKEEAESLNLRKARKLPTKVSDSADDLTSEEEDPTFDETK